jgi:AcrR family transcriptional regulator
MTSTRRHGEELERALLDAAWAELVENGYPTFTMDAVCARAGTSRPVLYRRWEDKHALVRAAVAHALARNIIAIPDTGTLRGDTIALMESADRDRMQLFAVMTVHLSGYYQETGTSPADLKEMLMSGRPRISRLVLDRAVARGEVAANRVTERIAVLPYALLQQEFLLTLKPVPTAVIEEIVDTIYLPLLVSR